MCICFEKARRAVYVFSLSLLFFGAARAEGSGAQIRLDSEHEGKLRAGAAAPDGTFYASGVLDTGGFIAHLNAAGEVAVWKKLDSAANYVVTDGANAVYLAGDSYLEKLDAALNPVYKTLIGTPASALAIGPDGTVLSGQGSRLVVYSGAGEVRSECDLGLDVRIAGIGVSSSGEVLLTGTTTSASLPGVRNSPFGAGDAFVTKMRRGEASVDWSVYLGGTESDGGAGIAERPDGRIIVAGYTTSSDFPGIVNGYSIHGERHGFVAHLDTGGKLLESRVAGRVRADHLPIQVSSAMGVNRQAPKSDNVLQSASVAPRALKPNGDPEVQALPWLLQNTQTIQMQMIIRLPEPEVCRNCQALLGSILGNGFKDLTKIIVPILAYGGAAGTTFMVEYWAMLSVMKAIEFVLEAAVFL